MFGRVLFAIVCLIIAAGVALPLYPRDIATSTVAVAAGPVQLVGGTGAYGCEDCPIADAGRADCRSDQALPALFVPLEDPVSLTVALTGRSLPARQSGSQRLPARLPAI